MKLQCRVPVSEAPVVPLCPSWQDAHNLAWKLSLVSQGLAEEDLLDSYQVRGRPGG